ncbi:hypothetical protein FJY71_01025 [candidate division WOR-3 bacterium]|nr:hypothetical protein [candidate division WOR-3 bacterium]
MFAESVPVLVSGRAINSYRSVPVAIDLDRDGRKDLVLGEWYSSVRFYRNTGPDSAPFFNGFINLVEPDPDSFLNGNPPRVNFTDWDGDTDQDMITCDYYGSVFLRRNVTQSGTGETGSGELSALKHGPTIARGVLLLARVPEPASLLDATGAVVMNLTSGPNDVRHLPPGIYFVSGRTAGKVVIQR